MLAICGCGIEGDVPGTGGGEVFGGAGTVLPWKLIVLLSSIALSPTESKKFQYVLYCKTNTLFMLQSVVTGSCQWNLYTTPFVY